jgi:hypothetical protein
VTVVYVPHHWSVKLDRISMFAPAAESDFAILTIQHGVVSSDLCSESDGEDVCSVNYIGKPTSPFELRCPIRNAARNSSDYCQCDRGYEAVNENRQCRE